MKQENIDACKEVVELTTSPDMCMTINYPWHVIEKMTRSTVCEPNGILEMPAHPIVAIFTQTLVEVLLL